jgi:hypothetical protein
LIYGYNTQVGSWHAQQFSVVAFEICLLFLDLQSLPLSIVVQGEYSQMA